MLTSPRCAPGLCLPVGGKGTFHLSFPSLPSYPHLPPSLGLSSPRRPPPAGRQVHGSLMAWHKGVATFRSDDLFRNVCAVNRLG